MISFRPLMLYTDPEWAGIEMENIRIREMNEVILFVEQRIRTCNLRFVLPGSYIYKVHGLLSERSNGD